MIDLVNSELGGQPVAEPLIQIVGRIKIGVYAALLPSFKSG